MKSKIKWMQGVYKGDAGSHAGMQGVYKGDAGSPYCWICKNPLEVLL